MDYLMLTVNIEFTFVDWMVCIGAFFLPFIAHADTRTERGFFGCILIEVVGVFA